MKDVLIKVLFTLSTISIFAMCNPYQSETVDCTIDSIIIDNKTKDINFYVKDTTKLQKSYVFYINRGKELGFKIGDFDSVNNSVIQIKYYRHKIISMTKNNFLIYPRNN